MKKKNSIKKASVSNKQEEDVLQSEKKFRSLVERLPGTVTYMAALDEHSTTTYISPQIELILGYPAEEYLTDQNLWMERIHPEDRDRVLTEVGECHRTGKALHTEYRMIHKDGRVIWFQDIADIIRDDEGKPLCLLGVNTDITERRKAEEELRESRAKLDAAMASMSDAVFISDLKGNLIDFNDAFAIFHKFKCKAECVRTVAEYPALFEVLLPSGEIIPLDMWPVSRALRGETVTNAEYVVRRKDTGERWFGSYSFAPIRDATGFIVGSVGVAHDITENKKAEEELRASRDQLRALAASLQTVREEERTRVARDIHDVLAQELIRLKIDLVWLQGRLLKPEKTTKAEDLAVRIVEMTRMADEAIQCVQRIATGLRPAVLDSLGLCATVEWQARDFQAHSGIPCNASVSAEEPHIGNDGATALFRILQESLANIQRHAKATRVDIVLREEDGQLILRICDNGCGIPEGTLINPLSFGLTGMKERALLLGGELVIQSKPGSGTAIEVRLPISKDRILGEKRP